MPYTVTATEYLEINSVPLATTAWKTVDVAPLFDSAPLRGANRLIPHLAGRTSYIRRRDEWVVQLDMVIFAARDWNNAVATNKRTQLKLNIEHLKANIVDPVTSGDGTRAATWHQAGATTKTANVVPLRLTVVQSAVGVVSAVRAVLELNVPAGQFT